MASDKEFTDSSDYCGVCALLDHQSAALSTVADAVAAMSCESLQADVASFNSVEGKEAIGVANDLKVLLNGSNNLVGKLKTEAVSEIPRIHAGLRAQVRLFRAKTREELNSGGKGVSEMRAVLLGLAGGLFGLGDYSLRRIKLDLEAVPVGSENLRTRLVELFGKQCPSRESLCSVLQSVFSAFDKNDVTYSLTVNELMKLVWKIVSWEAIIMFMALEGPDLSGREEVNGEQITEAGKEKKKKKKKKAVMGKGTTVVVQWFNDKVLQVQGEGGNAAIDRSKVLEIWVEKLLSFLEPNSPEFDVLLNKVKDIVESNETRRLPKLPKGTRDCAKEQMTIRKKAFSIIEGVFERHGATALDTPVFEMRDTLKGKYGEDSKLIFDLADQGGELYSLRYDLTVPFARYIAVNGITSFRRYQIGKVYRRDNPAKGRYREFYQCDFDITGQSEKMGPDFEVIYVLTELLDELNVGEYVVKLNHRKLLDGILEICGVPPDKFRTICSSIDKLDKLDFGKIQTEMVEDKGLSLEMAKNIGKYVSEKGKPLEMLSRLEKEHPELLKNSSSKEALKDLEILFKILAKTECINKISFDLSLARGLDYYTGVIFEAVPVMKDDGIKLGSIAAGGRYDNLIGMFGTKQVPAVGVSLGIERLLSMLEQIHKDQNQTIRATKTEVLVSVLGDDIGLAAELCDEFWKGKVAAEFCVSKRQTKHFDRAMDSKIPWMVIVGEKEQNNGVVRLKNVAVGEEFVIQRSDLVEELKKRL